MLNRPCRGFRFTPYRRLLCPVGEVFERAGAKPPHGVRHCVLWVRRHHRERESATRNSTQELTQWHPTP